MRNAPGTAARGPRQARAATGSRPGAGLLAVLALALLAGCARYEAKPLDTHAALPDAPRKVLVDPASLPFPKLAGHVFDPGDGLDETETAMLAVVNNPDLRTARADAGVSHAQAFAAGLLPDPQVGLSEDFPLRDVPGSNYTAYSVGLSYDLNALLTHEVVLEAGRASVRQADLGLVWQEWQTASRARLLFARIVSGQRLERLLAADAALLEERQARMDRALDAGDVTAAAAGADLAALADATGRLSTQRRALAKDRHDLNLLLGLAPETRLELVGEPYSPSLDEGLVARRLADLAQRRADLLALKWGYESQDAKYRKAILDQFPALNLGFNRASDTSNVQTFGFSVTMSLPLFDRNRGNIAVAKATRERLYDDFQARLAQAGSDVARLLDDLRLLRARLAELDATLPRLDRAEAAARKAADAGEIDEQSYLSLHAARSAKLAERITLAQSLAEQRLALETTLGCDPSVLEKVAAGDVPARHEEAPR
ncbi:outer membrane efflux protein [Desulfovibrio sp. X2]|uniref:TolC family protein n=1 Tax=Desulfovibrio sp. X2 TaxID=941449 RepID=UPI00035872A0|nr:TolC family protein [Desulfovibrio sp. X2]EPR43088.1 outer membrane efflux protein [Desulfovibrio sp. X2]